MKFDDFNYQIYNPYILVEEVVEQYDESPDRKRKGSELEMGGEEIELSKQILEQSIS